jgi:hypothetical protein
MPHFARKAFEMKDLRNALKVPRELASGFSWAALTVWEPQRRSRYPLRDREKHYGIVKFPAGS